MNSEHHVKNTGAFVQRLNSLKIQKTNLLESFNVVSLLFSWVPLKETLKLLKPLFALPAVELFYLALTSTYFLFDRHYYKKREDVAMGSLLSLGHES